MPSLVQSLKYDDLILIYIGVAEVNEPYLIPRQRISHISTVLKDKIGERRNPKSRDRTAIHFPHDDVGAWECLLHWIVAGDIDFEESDKPTIPTLIRAWSLGDKYQILDFQDTVMIALLRHYENNRVTIEEIRAAYETETYTKLKSLIAEETVVELYSEDSDLVEFNISLCAGLKDFIKHLAEATRFYNANPAMFSNRFERDNSDDPARWEEFLHRDGLKNLWQRNENGVPKAGKS